MVKVIAELCQNHNGSFEILKRMVWAAAEAGATYAKMQAIFSDDLTYRERFEEGITENGKVRVIKRPYDPEYRRLKSLDLDLNAHAKFLDECDDAGIKPLTTIFSRSRIPLALDLDLTEVKVASYDCASYPFLRELKERFRHLYVSTGATFDEEVEGAARILTGSSFSMMHCVTIYPTPLNSLNLARMNFLRRFTNEVGFSDHTLVERDGLKADIVALWMGAKLIERHFTILERSRTKDGPVSVDRIQLKELVNLSRMSREELEEEVRRIPNHQAMIGVEQPGLSDAEMLNRDYYRGRFASKVDGKTVFNWEEGRVS